MSNENQRELRYVFFTAPGRYDETLRFYRDDLGLGVAGGFSHGTYFRAGDAVIEVFDGDVSSDFQRTMLRGVEAYRPPRGGWLLLEVDDVDALHDRLRAGGATIVQSPVDRPWRFRDVTVLDPSGNLVVLFVRLTGWEAHHMPPDA